MKLTNLLYRDSTKITPSSLEKLKRSWAKELGHLPKHSELLSAYQELLEQKKLSPTPLLDIFFVPVVVAAFLVSLLWPS